MGTCDDFSEEPVPADLRPSAAAAGAAEVQEAVVPVS